MALNISLNQTMAAPSLTTDLNTIIGISKPLAIMIIGITIYAFFIFKFYRFLAERDVLKLKMHHKYGWHEGFLQRIFKSFFYTLEHIILVPMLIFFWFSIISAILIFLSNNETGQIMLISMALIGSVRITAYYNEDLSKDLAKMIPFAFLGVFIVDMNIISLQNTIDKGIALLHEPDKLLYYLFIVVIIEFVMRTIHLIRKSLKPKINQEVI